MKDDPCSGRGSSRPSSMLLAASLPAACAKGIQGLDETVTLWRNGLLVFAVCDTLLNPTLFPAVVLTMIPVGA